MKKAIYTFICLIFTLDVMAQWINKSFTFEGKLREYRVYLPAIYNPINPPSLLLTLHGLGDNMTNFSGIGMNYIADTANIIVLVPQALDDPLFGAAWNSGAGLGYYPNSSINDVGFLNAMIDSTLSQYAVNQQRIYICGFSMGGFMTERMACESNNRLAAIASVSGTIGNGVPQSNPARTIPVAHFHGTGDATVPYSNNTFGIDADSLVQFWVSNNHCDAPIHTTFPDVVSDSLTVEHFVYPNGWAMSEVEFFKVNNGGHDWLFIPQNDIDYTQEIWKFFSKHTLQPTAIEGETQNDSFSVFPNPAKDKLNISFHSSQKNMIQLFDIQGNLIFSTMVVGENTTISLQKYSLSQGLYYLKVNEKSTKLLIE